MNAALRNFIILFIVFSVGMFFGEYYLDYCMQDTRAPLHIEIRDSIFLGAIMATFFVAGFKLLRVSKEHPNG